MHYGLLFHDHGCAGRRGVEESFGHSLGQTNAAMGSGIGRHVTLVHRVASPEEHGKRHARPVVMRARRSGILPRIDVRFHDVTHIVDVIAKHRRDMLGILPKHGVIPGRRPEPGFAGGNGRFAHELFTLVEISALIGDTDHDLGRTGHAIPVPVTLRRGGRWHIRRGCLIFGATGHKAEDCEGETGTKKCLAHHGMRRVMRPVPGSIPKIGCLPGRRIPGKKCARPL